MLIDKFNDEYCSAPNDIIVEAGEYGVGVCISPIGSMYYCQAVMLDENKTRRLIEALEQAIFKIKEVK